MPFLGRLVERGARLLRHAVATRLAAGVLFGALAPVALVVACSDDVVKAPPTGAGSRKPLGPPDPCALPNEGCACDPGATANCGQTVDRSGDDVTCGVGTRTCEDGLWGECEITELQSLPLDAHSLQLLQVTDACDICDPYCKKTTEVPGDVDGGDSGVGLGPDGGLTVTGSGGGSPDGGIIPGATQTTTTGSTTCAGSTNLGTGPCNAAPITTCRQDTRCVADACVWNGPDGYFDPTAGGVDLTIGAACTSSGYAIHPVCNRGSAALAGPTTIRIDYVNPPLMDNPCLNAGGWGSAECTGSIPAAGLAAGQCVNIACPIAPVQNQIAIVNANTGTQIGEGMGGGARCGNNAAVADVQDTMGGTACSACTTCNTRVTGTVRDPGQNVVLSKITVFQPAGNLITLNDNGMTPQCDSCTSLLPNPPAAGSYTSAAYSATNGTFTLNYVTPGPNQRIVFQTGRWRRENVTMNITACADNPIAANLSRLPRNRTEGTIPKMALVTGNQESLECFVRKMGIDANEITAAPTTGSATGAQGRIHLYEDNGMITTRTTANGKHTCTGGATGLAGTACTASSTPDVCQQDHRCNGTMCVWNGADGYYDAAAGGVDLTIGATCLVPSTTTEIVPVCNRGSATVAAGANIRVDFVTTVPTDACAPGSLGTAECSVTLPMTGPGLAPGQCINVTGCNPADNNVAIVNGTLSITEAGGTGTTGRCRNNLATADTVTGCGTTPNTANCVSQPPASTLWSSSAQMNQYTAVLLPCSGTAAGRAINDITTTENDRFVSYANAGGRIFVDHYPADDMIRGSSDMNWPLTATWQISTNPTTPTRGKVLGSPPGTLSQAHNDFRDWLNFVGAYQTTAPVGAVIDEPKMHALTVPGTLPSAATPPIEWLRGHSTTAAASDWPTGSNGDYSLSYSFEAPLTAATKCGRVIYNGMHVSNNRSTVGQPFPSGCNLGPNLTAEEKALEYQLFTLTACAVTPPALPPPPSFPPALPPSADIYRDFVSNCPHGTQVRWEDFEWQGAFPMDTSIQFRVATAATQGALPGSPPAPSPTTHVLDTAWTTVLAPAWDNTSQTVDQVLAAASPPQVSQNHLRVYMRFVTSPGGLAPTLYTWRQKFSCPPAE